MSDGQTIALEIATTAGTGQMGMIIGKLFAAASEAEKRRGENGKLNDILNDIRPAAAIANPKISVANSIGPSGLGTVGLVMEIGGVPFTGMLSPETALELAEQLQSSAHDQATHTQRKPS